MDWIDWAVKVVRQAGRQAGRQSTNQTTVPSQPTKKAPHNNNSQLNYSNQPFPKHNTTTPPPILNDPTSTTTHAPTGLRRPLRDPAGGDVGGDVEVVLRKTARGAWAGLFWGGGGLFCSLFWVKFGVLMGCYNAGFLAGFLGGAFLKPFFRGLGFGVLVLRFYVCWLSSFWDGVAFQPCLVLCLVC